MSPENVPHRYGGEPDDLNYVCEACMGPGYGHSSPFIADTREELREHQKSDHSVEEIYEAATIKEL